MSKTIVATSNAPAAIGTYSQAIKAGNTVYVSGQIPLDPKTMELVEGFEEQTVQVFENLKAVIEASGGYLHYVAKLNIFLTDLSHFAKVNEVMAHYCSEPYPARAAVGSLVTSASPMRTISSGSTWVAGFFLQKGSNAVIGRPLTVREILACPLISPERNRWKTSDRCLPTASSFSLTISSRRSPASSSINRSSSRQITAVPRAPSRST